MRLHLVDWLTLSCRNDVSLLGDVGNWGMVSSHTDTVGQHNFQGSCIHLASHRSHYVGKVADIQLKHTTLFRAPVLNQEPYHEDIWGSGSVVEHILNLSTRWKWVVNFTSWPLYLQERTPGTHWRRGWVGTRAGLDRVAKRKILTLARNLTPIVQPIT